MNDRYFDLANFSVNNELSEDDDRVLLEAYFGAADDRRFAALRLMRVVSDLREAAWGAVQDGRSQLDFDYAAYSREHADRARALRRRPAAGGLAGRCRGRVSCPRGRAWSSWAAASAARRSPTTSRSWARPTSCWSTAPS